MHPRHFFPLGKAQGEAFCNREIESKNLLGNIRAVKHTLIIAPRRFGKSSLADKVINLSSLSATDISFNTCTDEYEIEQLIRKGAAALISKTLGPTEKIINSVKKHVGNLIPKIVIGPEYAHLELSVNKTTNPAVNVEESLMLIEKLLQEKKQHAIMVLDEFQSVGLIARGKGVEAAIRNAAQNMHHLMLIFSGSNRSLLKIMFEDEGRPLYKLCRKLQLQRIESHHYQKHLNKAAKMMWKKELASETFEQIMLLSEQHPYYVNYLCDILWTESKNLPKVKDVFDAWNQVIEEEKSDANAEISKLAISQKKVIKYIAKYSEDHLMSANASKVMGVALSSIMTAITSLLEKDIIEKHDHGYRIINPIIKKLVSNEDVL